MRHRNKNNHLGRTASHRAAMLSNMASSLLIHKRIQTTLAKAKALRRYVEPLITKSKKDTTHSRRTVFSYLQNKYAVKALFTEVAPLILDRPGGYTRILKLGPRPGDNAEMALMELVDFNEYLAGESIVKRKSRRAKKKPAAQTPKAQTNTPAAPEVATAATEQHVEAITEAETVSATEHSVSAEPQESASDSIQNTLESGDNTAQNDTPSSDQEPKPE